MNTTEIRIKEAQEKFSEWVEYLATRTEDDLVKRLEINHQQYAIAEKQKQDDTCRLLNIMERIIIEARIYKAEHNIADIPSEIETALEEMEMLEEKAEERIQVLKKQKEKEQDVSPSPTMSVEIDEPVKDNRPTDEQLSLF